MDTVKIDMGWTGAAEILVPVLIDGTTKGRADAQQEIRRMARVADKLVALVRLVDEVGDSVLRARMTNEILNAR